MLFNCLGRLVQICTYVVLKILVGVGLGFLLFTNPEAMQITAGLLRAAGDALAPAVEDEGRKTLQNRINEVLKSDQ